jgi:hypothetical protein
VASSISPRRWLHPQITATALHRLIHLASCLPLLKIAGSTRKQEKLL